MSYEPNITVGPKVNEADLGNGFYKQLSTPVALDDDYRNKLRWLGTQCSTLPAAVVLIAQSRTGDVTEENGLTPDLPAVIGFGPQGSVYRLDAALVGVFPHIARVELIRHFGGGDPAAIVMYAPPPPPQPDGQPSPVGARWPEMDSRAGGQAYRPSVGNPMAKPFKAGDTYKDATGTYRLTFVWVTFANCAVWVK